MINRPLQRGFENIHLIREKEMQRKSTVKKNSITY
jgi:hypothetical protein